MASFSQAMKTAATLVRHVVVYLLPWTPALVLLRFAQWHGWADDQRWLLALQVAAPVAALYFLIGLALRRPLQRLPMGANLYVLLGGLCALFMFEPGLNWLGQWREAAVLACILAVGVVTMLASPHGYIGAVGLAPASQRRLSLLLLAATVLALAWAVWLRGHPLLAAVLPITLLGLLRRALLRLAPDPATGVAR
jgi:hypothetical protein